MNDVIGSLVQRILRPEDGAYHLAIRIYLSQRIASTCRAHILPPMTLRMPFENRPNIQVATNAQYLIFSVLVMPSASGTVLNQPIGSAASYSPPAALAHTKGPSRLALLHLTRDALHPDGL
jgi:hypothetical protein